MDTKEWFKDRWERLGDLTELLKVVSPKYHDPKVYFQELILDEEDESLAERRLRTLENQCKIDEEERIKIQLQGIRLKRNEYLKETDWTQLPDSPFTSDQKHYYRKYRQYLRNLPRDIEDKKLPMKLMDFEEWNSWVKSIRNTPEFQTYVP